MAQSAFKLILGTKNWSSWSLRAWLMMRQCDVPFEEVVIRLRREGMREELDALSPSGLVPAMYHGDLKIWDSLAIAEYLAEQFPDVGLWPNDQEVRAISRSVCAEMHSGFMPMRQTMSMDFLAKVDGFEPDESTQQNIERIKKVWSLCRENYGSGGAFLFGEWGLADAMYAPVVSRFTTYGIELNNQLSEYIEAVWANTWMQEWKEACEVEAREL